jgi:hypothetical protein
MIVKSGKFVDFSPGGATLEAAVEAAEKRRAGGRP